MSRQIVAVVLAIIVVTAVVGSVIFVKRRHPDTSTLPVAQTSSTQLDPDAITYLPLGDSYTIGQSVAETDRWPNQLAALLQVKGTTLKIVANPSVTGYTSQNLIDRELPLMQQLKPDFSTILIGVNDYVQQVPIATFQKNLEYIVQTVQASLPHPGNIVLVTIPDFGKTPTGAQFGDPVTSQHGIEAFNNVIKQVAAAHQLPVADIFPVSQAVASDQTLVASDGLHPSGKEYAAWTTIIDQTLAQNSLPQTQ